MTLGRVLYDNALRDTGATLSYSAAEVSGFEKENVRDWRDFSLFRAAQGTTSLFVNLAAARSIDHLSIYFKTPTAAGTFTLDVYYDNGSGITPIITGINLKTTNEITMVVFPAIALNAAQAVDLTFTFTVPTGETVDFRQLVIGEGRIFPIGQHEGVTPPSLLSGITTTNVISTNGSIIARNEVRKVKAATISLEFLEQSYVRDTWEPFAQHAKRYPFFYAWNWEDRSSEVVWAAAKSIDPPRNTSPPGKMTVRMPLVCIGNL